MIMDEEEEKKTGKEEEEKEEKEREEEKGWLDEPLLPLLLDSPLGDDILLSILESDIYF
jgi:hypothetical protein